MSDLSLKLLCNSELLMMIIGSTIIFFILKFFKGKFKFLNKNFAIISLTIIYSFLIFYNLGSHTLASSTFDPKDAHEEVILSVDNSFNKIVAISGEGDNNLNNGTYQIYYRDIIIEGAYEIDGEYYKITTLDEDEFYKYYILELEDYLDYNYIKLTFPSKNSVLTELWLLNDDELCHLDISYYSNIENFNEAYKIIDEQDTLALDPDYMDETFFDEIYHVRNAYEIASGQKMYTAVHPLLGTEIIALGIKLFGFNPFGFRFFGALFSVLMIPLIYLFAKEFFKEKWAFLVALLFSLDFMHYTTGRIATLEPFSVFFIILMFYMMIKAIKIDYTKNLKKHFLFLALSGLSMGCAISTKWTGAYGAVGLAIIFFIFEIRYFIEALKRKDNRVYLKTFYLFLWSLLFFIIIPLIIYVISFIPVPMYAEKWNNLSEFIDQVIRYNTYMFEYHVGLESTHPYSSRWYMWLFDIRPIWYYVKRADNYMQTISCFNNPLLSISGVIAIIYLIYYLIKKRKSLVVITLLIMYLSNLIPWIFISRTNFAYHYYPSYPFLILILVYAIYLFYYSKNIPERKKYLKYLKIFISLVFILFIAFLPVIGGFKTPYFYPQIVLRRLPSWFFG